MYIYIYIYYFFQLSFFFFFSFMKNRCLVMPRAQIISSRYHTHSLPILNVNEFRLNELFDGIWKLIYSGFHYHHDGSNGSSMLMQQSHLLHSSPSCSNIFRLPKLSTDFLFKEKSLSKFCLPHYEMRTVKYADSVAHPTFV